MPVICLNASAYSTSEPPDIMNTSSYNATTTAPQGISDPGDPLVYILAVLSFYVLSITILLAKSIHGGREEKSYEYYYNNFIKRDRLKDNSGYKPSAIKTIPPKLPKTSQTHPPPGKPALKQHQGAARPKTKETVRLLEPSEVKKAKNFSKRDKKKLPHKTLEPVLTTSV